VRSCVEIEPVTKEPGLRAEAGWLHEPELRIQREWRFKRSCRILRLLARLTMLFCLFETAHAQYGFEVWTVDNGMPENEIRGITQTPDGYLWIATFNGLARFDGVHLTVFNRDTPGLLSNQFGTMLQGKAGDLWLDSVDRGVVRYHGGVFQVYGRQYGVPADVINGLTGDDHGDVWVLSGDRIVRWEEALKHFVDIAPQSPRLRYRSLLWDSAGFWVHDHEKIRCFTQGKFVDFTLPKQIVEDALWGAALDQSGTLWLESVDGKRVRITADNVSHMIPAKSAQEVTVGTTSNKSLVMHVGPRLQRTFDFISSNRIISVTPWHFYEDRQGNLWIGTQEAGLYRLQKQLIRSYTREQGLVDRDTYATYQDRSGAVWVGAWHLGLSRFADGKFTNYTMADGLPDELVTALFEDRDGRFWVGTHGGLSIFDHGRFHIADGPILPNEAVVQAICQDRQGTLWFGTRQGLARYEHGVTRFFTQKDGLAANDTHTILETSNGDLWVGGYGGLTRIQNGKFTHWTENDGLPSNNIWSFYEDNDRVLWIGTYEGGLVRYKDGKFINYSVKDGLFDNGVFRVLEDAHGYFWISCSRGVYRVSKRDLNAFAAGDLKKVASTAYGKIDGMLDIECNGGVDPSGMRTRDGKLWFPTRNGVAIIDPEAVMQDSVPPLVMIESSVVDNVTTPVNAPLRLPPRRPSVEISYTAPNFINATQTHFKYRLEGLDSDWVDAGGRRTAYYSHLPSGEYVFQVIAGNSDGVWNEEGKTLAITVLTPFYQTGWFQMLVLLTLGALIAISWRYRVAQLQRAQAAQQAFSRQLIASQEAERKRIAGEMHDSLGQRLVVIKNLAFLLLRSKKTAPAEGSDAQTIAEISEEASSAIAETREISYNLRPFQLDRLGLTKAIEAMIRTTGIASGIRFTSELDNIDDIFPEDLRINFYRIVQESLGNIMKHAQATEVNVRVKRRIENVSLTIEDNGRGFTPDERSTQPSHSGFGLTGMGERAKLLGGELKVRSIQGRGTTVLFETALRK
jgi:signal transduction histidine kinase/ligand-binding sensor domain-containing protein